MDVAGTALVLALALQDPSDLCGTEKQLPRQGVTNPEAGVWVLNISLSEGYSLALTDTLVRPCSPGCGTA